MLWLHSTAGAWREVKVWSTSAGCSLVSGILVASFPELKAHLKRTRSALLLGTSRWWFMAAERGKRSWSALGHAVVSKGPRPHPLANKCQQTRC